MRHSTPFFALILLIVSQLSAHPLPQEDIKEEVIVIGTRIPTDFSTLARTVTIIDRKAIDASPARSISELLQTVMSLDVRPRGPAGVQADLSIRGSDFSQVLVMVDGIRLTDPQTGHHNLNLPISLDDVERIEVLRGQGSAPYGENALGGVVNIVTKKSDKKGIMGTLSGGLHNTLGGRIAAHMAAARIQQTFSLDYNRSDGFAFDRDFDILNLSSRTSLNVKSADLYLLAGFQNKAFGANGFYGPYPSKEWTQTRFIALKGEFKGLKINLFNRWHRDKFMLDIDRPDFFTNLHKTLSTGIEASRNVSLSPTCALVIGSEVRRDSISGEQMGHRSYSKAALFSEYQTLINRVFQIQAGLRWDYFSNFGSELSPSVSVSIFKSSRAKFRASAGHAFRIPSFTELYYYSPANRGNPELKSEHSLSMEGGLDLTFDKIQVSATLFHRRDRDLIDWIKREDSEVWQAENIRKVNFLGFEIFFSRTDWLRLGYTYLHSDLKQSPDFISKYRLNHPAHQITGNLMLHIPLGIKADISAMLKKRTEDNAYLIVDARLRKSFKVFDIFLTITNLLNVEYEEIPGVRMQGRWIGLGMDFGR